MPKKRIVDKLNEDVVMDMWVDTKREDQKRVQVYTPGAAGETNKSGKVTEMTKITSDLFAICSVKFQ